MKNLSKFQLIFYGVFILAIFIGVGLIAISRSKTAKVLPEDETVTMWGTQEPAFINQIIEASGAHVKYSKKNATTFYQDYIEALANGQGPDMFLFTESEIYPFRSRLAITPYTTYPERTFIDNFVDGAVAFRGPNGIEAFPIAQNPLVLYWNKDIFSNKGLFTPPSTWQEIPALIPNMTRKDTSKNITDATIALGVPNNVNNSKAILSSLIMQAGGEVAGRNTNGRIESHMLNNYGNSINPSVASVDFYSQFSNPSKVTYTWNRALLPAKTMFTSGNLAMYVGFASENSSIKDRNPNLNYDIAPLPQAVGNGKKAVYSKFYAVAISNRTSKYSAALKTAFTLSGSGASWSPARTDVFPVQKSVLLSPQKTANTPIFYKSALWGRTWIDPNSRLTDNIFNDLIENIASGRFNTHSSVEDADGRLGGLFR